MLKARLRFCEPSLSGLLEAVHTGLPLQAYDGALSGLKKSQRAYECQRQPHSELKPSWRCVSHLY